MGTVSNTCEELVILFWMRPGYYETEDEYKISKELLFRYISSESALQAAGGHQQLLDTVKRWVQNKVIVSENHFLFYLRKHKRAFHTYCSNAMSKFSNASFCLCSAPTCLYIYKLTWITFDLLLSTFNLTEAPTLAWRIIPFHWKLMAQWQRMLKPWPCKPLSRPQKWMPMHIEMW